MKDAWRLFLGVCTQWRTAGMAGTRIGLDYNILEPTARSLGIEVPLATMTFNDIRLLEAEVLATWSRKNRS